VVTTALAFGLVLMALAYAIGHISGCHVNPAVTMGFMAAGRMKIVDGIAYMIAQVAGAIAGSLILWQILSDIPGYSRHIQGLGTDGYGVYSLTHLSQKGAFITEVVLTFVFVLVVLMATHKASIQGAAGLAIGMALVVVHLIGIPLTGTSVNPARSFGPALIVGGHAMSQVWLFIVAPLVGAIIAALVHLLSAGRTKDEAAA
jgi:aquaporin Z